MHAQGRPSLRTRLATSWSSLTSPQRRRILLAALLAVAVASRDLLLLVVTAGLFAFSELAPAPRPARRRQAAP